MRSCSTPTPTTTAEFALLRMLTHKPNGRCVYMAPSDAVAAERYNEWSAKFGSGGLGKEVVLLNGEQTDLKLLARGMRFCFDSAAIK